MDIPAPEPDDHADAGNYHRPGLGVVIPAEIGGGRSIEEPVHQPDRPGHLNQSPQEENQRKQGGEPAGYGNPRVGAQRPVFQPEVPVRFVRRPALHPLHIGPQMGQQRVRLVRLRQQRQQFPFLRCRQGGRNIVADLGQGVDQRIGRRVGSHPPHRPQRQENRHEDDIDEADGGGVEIIVVGGDELAQFVDESAKADTAGDGRQPRQRAAEKGEQQQQGGQHQPAAPQHMGDVQAVAAQLRVARRRQKSADGQHRGHGGHQEQLQQLAGRRVPHQAAPPTLKSLVAGGRRPLGCLANPVSHRAPTEPPNGGPFGQLLYQKRRRLDNPARCPY